MSIRRRGERRRTGAHIARAVAAGPVQAATRVDDLLVHRLQVRLENAVDLERGARRQAQRVVAEHLAHVVDGLKHFGGTFPRRHLHTQHELVLFQLAAHPLIAVILLVSAVELDQADTVVRYEDVVVGEILGQRMPQIVRMELGHLVRIHAQPLERAVALLLEQLAQRADRHRLADRRLLHHTQGGGAKTLARAAAGAQKRAIPGVDVNGGGDETRAARHGA
eukprot:ctg_1139.g392